MKKLVVLSGAGMSAESGISTFRDSGGLWEQYNIEDVATPAAWSKNAALVHHFYNLRRNQLMESEPNRGHFGLVELEKYFDVRIITQNVDNLHERAGSKFVLHLHGELMKVRSTGPAETVYKVTPAKLEYSIDDFCPNGYPLRPHIVWFGETVPEMDNAIKIIENADILVIVGTSMQVYPAAGLIRYLRPQIPVFLIDPNVVSIGIKTLIQLKYGASEGVERLKELLEPLR
jgi:NAD-dependent deacetylase